MQPHTSYLVCATQRSGSTLLCEALFNIGIAGHAQEYFDALKKTGFPRQPLEYFEGIDTTEISAIFGDTSRPGEQPAQPAPGESYAQYLDKVFKWGMTPNGVFGAKVMWGYFHDFISKLRDIPQYSDLAVSDLLATVFPNLHYIWVTRRDKVGQAVSLWKAIQTWTWKQEQASLTASGRPVKHLTFHFGAIDHLVQQLVAYEAAWRQYFTDHDIQPFTVVYEELTETYEETVRAILHYLDIPLSEKLEFAERRMKRQANALSDEWIERYYQLKRTHEEETKCYTINSDEHPMVNCNRIKISVLKNRTDEI